MYSKLTYYVAQKPQMSIVPEEVDADQEPEDFVNKIYIIEKEERAKTANIQACSPQEEQRDLSPTLKRFPSVTLQEVDNEDQHDPQPGSPHPFAFPTRPTLFPEPYDNPTAGFAMYFYEVPKNPPPLYNAKLANPDTFKGAYWLANLCCSQQAKNPYFELPRTRCWYWKNMSQLNQDVDLLPHGRDVVRVYRRVPAQDLLGEFESVEKTGYMGRNGRVAQNRAYIQFSQRIRTRRANPVPRVYDGMWSGDWWWRMQLNKMLKAKDALSLGLQSLCAHNSPIKEFNRDRFGARSNTVYATQLLNDGDERDAENSQNQESQTQDIFNVVVNDDDGGDEDPFDFE
ncbi:hypothetical protein RhiJN_10453 [Ceratobasidium sp. AG-Ba]|nr:hypothetical protein RhiJN_10453 [Ceratobasidium sp. AG-Ba]QRW11182.1 hypothetical protein RhiLY_10181 [Ceratobasidium sp. AG-Ba]